MYRNEKKVFVQIDFEVFSKDSTVCMVCVRKLPAVM